MTDRALSVTDITVESLAPRVDQKKYAKWLPRTCLPERMQLTIKDTNNAVANAIRRTICGELPVRALVTTYEDVTTNDDFIIQEMLCKRLLQLPILQSTPLTAQFTLYVENRTPLVRAVYASEIELTTVRDKGATATALPFNATVQLFALNPGCWLRINKITVGAFYGYEEGRGMCCLASAVVSAPIDVDMLNKFERDEAGRPRGTSTSVSDPRVWRLSFVTNGTMAPRAIVAAACAELITRVRAVEQHLPNALTSGDQHTLTIPGESDTIGNLLVRAICDLYPDVDFVTYSTASAARELTIKLRTTIDIETIFVNAITHLADTFAGVSKAMQ